MIPAERTPQRLTDLAQERVAAVLETGSVAVDATVGNGHDTLFLRRMVGAAGRVYGFDVQPSALDNTRQLLTDTFEVMPENVELLQRCHSSLGEYVGTRESAGVSAVMFNLGYLPGGDHRITTASTTTLPAIEQAVGLLRPGGCLTVMVYTGQKGGNAELELMLKRAGSDSSEHAANPNMHPEWTLYESEFSPKRAPKLFIAQKHGR